MKGKTSSQVRKAANKTDNFLVLPLSTFLSPLNFFVADDVCAVFKPAVTLLTVFKESKNAEFRLNLLSCLERVGICHCISPQILVTSLLKKYVFLRILG